MVSDAIIDALLNVIRRTALHSSFNYRDVILLSLNIPCNFTGIFKPKQNRLCSFTSRLQFCFYKYRGN